MSSSQPSQARWKLVWRHLLPPSCKDYCQLQISQLGCLWEHFSTQCLQWFVTLQISHHIYVRHSQPMSISDFTCGFSPSCVVKVGIGVHELGPLIKSEQEKRRLLPCWRPWHLNIHRDPWLFSCSLTEAWAGVQGEHGWMHLQIIVLCSDLTRGLHATSLQTSHLPPREVTPFIVKGRKHAFVQSYSSNIP